MKKNPNQILDEALNDIRYEAIDPSAVKNAADRVWARVAHEENIMANTQTPQAEHIRNCDDFQSLIPAYLSQQLTSARVMLFEDHTRECFACRKELKAARTATAQPKVVAATATKNSWFSFKQPQFRFAFAALLVLGLGLGGWPIWERIIDSFRVFNAVVMASNGNVYRVNDAQNTPLKSGEKINRGERLRTAKGSTAVVKLSDGSLIEMAERSEFSLSDNPDGTTINLNQGNVIVQAAKQKNKHLYVKTNDALVSVVGTIFSVNNGTKGSRVSVVEGEVHVEHDSKDAKLLPGDQVTTNASIERIAIKNEIAWSANSARYSELLDEVEKLRKDIAELPRPGVRYSTRILDAMPESTVFYVALPNLSETLNASYSLVKQRIEQNPELQSWWNNNNKGEGDKLFSRVREYGSYLGEEISLSSSLNNVGHPTEPLVIAELRNAAGLRTALEQIADSPVQIIDDPATAQAAAGKDVFVWMNGDLLAVSSKLASIQHLAVSLKAANNFKSTSFYASIARRYQEGTSLIIAADLQKIAPQLTSKNQGVNSAHQELGLLNLKHFIAEIKDGNGKSQNSAELTFAEANKGVAAWLAQPAPMGSLKYISPDANIVGAFVVKEPSAMADNLITALKTVEPKFGEDLAKFESEHGVNLRNDIAAPLGGEFAFALDGPVIPTPCWKIIVEVYDQSRMQQTLERLVEEINAEALKANKKGLALTKSEQGNQTFYVIKSLDFSVEINYAYVKGYLIATPGQALIDRAIRYAESGSTITSSPRFIASLPEDKQANFSAMIYQNLAPIVNPITQNLGNINGKMKDGELAAITALAGNAPSLAYAYSFGDRVTVSVNTEKGAVNLGDLLSLPGSMAMHGIIKSAMKH